MIRKTILMSALLLGACEPASPPVPNIVSIEPEEVVSGQEATLSLTLDALPPMRIDYGHRTATLLAPLMLRIGEQEIAVDAVEQDGTLRATVPGNLATGQQEVRLVLEDGTESAQEQGLMVLPPPPALPSGRSGDGTPTSDGTGSGPVTDPGSVTPGEGAARVTGIQIDPIGDQVKDVPFTITLRAQGPGAARFTGQVQLTTNKGHLSPNLSGTFLEGVRQEQVVLDKQGGNVSLTIRLGDGITVQSNAFKVMPR